LAELKDIDSDYDSDSSDNSDDSDREVSMLIDALQLDLGNQKMLQRSDKPGKQQRHSSLDNLKSYRAYCWSKD
jgi:hypothetical protein